MGLLDGDIQTIAHSALASIMLDATVTQETDDDPSDYTPGTGLTPTSTDYTCKGFVEDDAQRYIDQGLITQGDRVVTILQGSLSITPKAGDKVTIRSTTSTIDDVGQDPAIATWILGVTP